jgi:cytochrome c oxidase assembly protein subunit 15
MLACATFPLIWVGGLVTTYDAGMAVPDWPTTYGYNLFLYPLTTWIAGPWDLFIEHGHRLLGALVGVITIALVVATWKSERRTWLRWAVLAALALVIFQGVLGGQRVVRNSRQLAQIHGIIGPAFFTLSVFLVAATSKWWRQAKQPAPGLGDYFVSAWMMAGLALLQLVLGSQLRHVDSFTSSGTFSACVAFHITGALLLLVMATAVSISACRQFKSYRELRWPAAALGMLVACQVALGAGTWIVKYGWPPIAANLGLEVAVIVQAESLLQAMVTTAHVASGSLILALSVAWASKVTRLSTAKLTPAADSSESPTDHRDLMAGSIA